MTSYFVRRSTCVCLLAVLSFATPVRAQTPPSSAPLPNTEQAPPAPVGEDAAALQLAEPEYRLINLPTTLMIPARKMSFDLTHRFGGNLAQNSFQEDLETLFGLDDGAAIGLELRYGVMNRVQAAVFRTNIDRTIQFHGRWDTLRQGENMPVAASLLLSIEGNDNFADEYTPAVGAVVARRMGDRGAVYASPVWVHNSVFRLDEVRDTFMVGLGGRIRLSPSVYVTAEVTPRFAGYQPGPAEYGFAIEARAGGHMFQLNFTNTFSTTLGQIARGGNTDSLYLGFNLARKFF